LRPRPHIMYKDTKVNIYYTAGYVKLAAVKASSKPLRVELEMTVLFMKKAYDRPVNSSLDASVQHPQFLH